MIIDYTYLPAFYFVKDLEAMVELSNATGNTDDNQMYHQNIYISSTAIVLEMYCYD